MALCLCACAESASVGTQSKAENTGGARVVVAVEDSAFNPYHEYFYAGSAIYGEAPPASVTPAVLAEFGIGPEDEVELTRSGNMASDLAADAGFWNSVRRGRPYWFKGSNLIGVSFCEPGQPLLRPHAAKNPHGVATSASVLRATPEAIILMVEVCDHSDFEDIEFGHWHPAVDIVNQSSGFVGPLPVSSHGSYISVVEMGKLKFQAAGNEPNPTPIQGGPGNWWVIGVSGIDEYRSRGQSLAAANAPDFVSNYSDEMPYCMDCESGLVRLNGTSLSSPRAAGVAARVLLEARRAHRHQGGIRMREGASPAMVVGEDHSVTNWDLRRALEAAAYTGYRAADFSPVLDETDPLSLAAVPVNDAAPWLQIAWGDLSPEPDKGVVPEALAQLGLGLPGPAKDPGYCAFQTANMRFRQAYWDAVGLVRMMGELVPAPNPYLYCDLPGLDSP